MNKKFKGFLCGLLSFCFLFMNMPENVVDVFAGSSPITVKVGKDGSCRFKTIQEALDSISIEPTLETPVTIVVGKGVYEEKVTVSKPYITIRREAGLSPRDVIITYDNANGHVDDPAKNMGTQKSATFTVEKSAVGFSAEGITFQNSYNVGDENSHRKQSQAVAFVSLTDKAVLENCRFIGRQDTLYLKGAAKGKDVFGDVNNARVYLKKCYIEGTVDFIFGDATAFFDECTVNMAYHENGGHYTAANTTLSNIGFVFNKCVFTADKAYGEAPNSKIDLGRPWQADSGYPYSGSNTVLINCTLPSCLNPKGFIPWNENTVIDKIRYMEYGSEKTDERNGFVRILTKEQAESYSLFNVLRGNDNWNPIGKFKASEHVNALGITLDKTYVEIPKNSSASFKALVLPLSSTNKNVKWHTVDESVASVDENGNVTGIKEGKTRLIAKTEENDFTAEANIVVRAEKTDAPVIKNIEIGKKENISVGDTLTAVYSYELKSDEDIDNAEIKWFAVDENGGKILLKQGRGKVGQTYSVSSADIGKKIGIEVIPETKTSYGETGIASYAETESSVLKPDGRIEEIFIRKDFSHLTEGFENIDGGKAWGSVSADFLMRFDPNFKSIDSNTCFDIYSDFTGKDKSYYKLSFKKGGKADSLKVFLYKKADGEEEFLISSGEIFISDNEYFRVKETIDNDVMDISVVLEGIEKPLISMTYTDSAHSGGFMALENSGFEKALYAETVTVSELLREQTNDDAIRIYLAGDSTVKSYGYDNSIGGWGEYLQDYFDSDYVQIINKAEGGRSTRSYINQGRLDDIIKDIRKGDFLFIQFGHNDARTDDNAFLEYAVPLGEPDENGIYPTTAGVKSKTPQVLIDCYKDMPYGDNFYAYDSGGSFKWFLKQYVLKAKEKGAVPVLITPVARVFFDADGKITPHHGENDGYVKAVLQTAEEMDVACVDMFAITKELYENYGVRVTQGLQNVKSDGSMDITHYSKFGSNIITSKFIDALRDEGIATAIYSKPSDKSVSKTEDMKTASVYIAGDSTARSVDSGDYALQRRGWGDYVGRYFVDKLSVKNMAVEGKSSKSYIKEESYKNIFENIKEGDYLLIQFGGNDENKSTVSDSIDNYTNPDGDKDTEGSFKYYLYNYYIKPALDKKAVPILISPCSRNIFGNDGKVSDSHGKYDDAVRELAAELSLFYVDMTSATASAYNENGSDISALYHALYKNADKGSEGVDETNYNRFGAEEAAKILLRQLEYSSATIKNYIKSDMLNKQEFVSRGDFITDIMGLIDVKIFSDDNFSDVPNGKSYTKAVCAAKQIGIAEKSSNNLFKPEDNITEDDMIKFTENILNLKNKKDKFDFSVFDEIDSNGGISPVQSARVVKELYDALNS